MIDPTAQLDADERHAAEVRCMICGGLMIKQHVLNNCHRHKDDCIGHLKLAFQQVQSLALKREEIQAEIAVLEPFAKDYDTVRQSNDTCLATGAHDALRWALGLAEQSISEVLTRDSLERNLGPRSG